MTQTNNDEALKKALLELECYKGEILLDGNRPNDLRDLNETILIVKPAIAQNEQQEAVYVLTENLNKVRKFGSLHVNLHSCLGQQIKSSSEYTALFTSPPKQAIPDGWKLVPIEPTEEMIKAMTKEAVEQFNGDDFLEQDEMNIACYKAMLNVAPTNTEVRE